jgi:prophage tail gpP-like protein
VSDLATLKVAGAVYGGWQSIEIKRSIEQIAGTFRIQASERWPGQLSASPVRRGQSCEVLIGSQTVITGYIDETEPEFDATTHSLALAGRDKTADLVDCSAIFKTGQWKGRKLDQIARDICAPFGIQVIVKADVGTALPSFNIQEGERAFETLDRAARMRAVLLMSDGLGNLVIGRADSTRVATDLVEGVNIKKGHGKFDAKERFRHYVVKGQSRTAGQASGTADDTTITRYRPIVVLAEDQGHIASFTARAEWERNVRLGRSNRATVTVQGWSHAAGLWQPNRIVHLASPSLYADLDLLIAGVTYRLDGNGTTAELELVRPEAFGLLAGIKGTRLDRAISAKKREGAAVRVRGDSKAWLRANTGAGYSANISTTAHGDDWQ